MFYHPNRRFLAEKVHNTYFPFKYKISYLVYKKIFIFKHLKTKYIVVTNIVQTLLF